MAKSLVQQVLELNRRHSELFVSQRAERARYHAEHPTNIAVLKCMDGRIRMWKKMKMPRGVIRPFRNIGGAFDLGWTALNLKVDKYVRASLEKDRNILFIVTYHYSEGETHRGCRGHEYDTERAIASATAQTEQFREVFAGYDKIYTILVGVETDHQTLYFHGLDGRIVSMADLANNASDITKTIRSLYPDMREEIVRDLVPIMSGNIRHSKEVREKNQEPETLEHQERIIALGQDFEWVPHNLALVIDDIEWTLDDTIGKAAGIIKGNRDAGRIPNTKALLLACAHYEEDGYERQLAIQRARKLTELGIESIRKFHPDLVGFFETLTCVMRWQDRLLEPI